VRPIYETEKDRENEAKIIARLAIAWAFEPKKLSREERLDYAGIRGGVECLWIEAKRRYNKRRKYETLAISNAKIEAGLEIQENSGWPFYLAIEWDDGLFYLRVKRERIAKVEPGGRYDRNDPFDQEDMAHFDVELFHEVDLCQEN
jgi:hypothetical protein